MGDIDWGIARSKYLLFVRVVPSFVLLAGVALAGCAAGAVERNAVCERGSAIETAVQRIGELPRETKQMNAAVLRNQLDEDLTNLTAALDVAPRSIVGDLSTIGDRLRDLYAALEVLDWDAARFVSDETLDAALNRLDSVNTRRHLARLSGYLIEECTQEAVSGSAPPDTVVAIPSTSTALPSSDDPIPADQDLLTAHVAMGTAMAEAQGVEVSVDQAECLGREADVLSIEADNADAATWQQKWNAATAGIFAACGVTVTDRPAP